MISKVFFYLCLSFILGITLSFLNRQGILFLIVFGFGLILIFSSFFIKEFCIRQKIKIVSLLIIIFLISSAGISGWVNYNRVANPEIISTDLSYFNDHPERVEIKGVIKRVKQRTKNNRLIVEIEKIKIDNQEKVVDGRVMAFIPRVVRVNYGDLITLEGELQSPQKINGFNWPMHLANDGIRSVMFRPWVTVVEEDQGTFVMSKIHSLNAFFQQKINRFLPYPESAILSAMLLGNRGEIPDKVSHNFRQIGLGHILAISGLHITIISAIFFWITLSLGFWRKHAFILTSPFLIFFILMIGAPPSAIRAGIMGFLFLLAQYFGRSYSFQNAIIITATAILIFQPLSLFHCISFQFSFAAILAILLLFPIFQYYTYKKLRLKEKEKPILSFFLNTFLISSSILLFLGPLMAYHFGNFPAVSPLINLFAIPLLAPILFFGIMSLFSATIFPPLTLIFSSIVYLLLSLLINFSAFINTFAFIELLQFSIPIYFLIVYYIALFAIILKLKKTASPSPLLKF